MNVLIAIDKSATAHAALSAALSRRWPAGTNFRVLTVVPISKGSDLELPQRIAAAQRIIQRATALIEAENPDSAVIGEIATGDPITSILRTAEQSAADLIVVGSHDRGPFERFFTGSVSKSVVDRANCSVLIARNFNCFWNRVLVAVDESEESKSALASIAAAPWAADTQFRLMTAVDLPPEMFTAGPSAAAVNSLLEIHRDRVVEAQNRLESYALAFPAGAYRISRTVREAPPRLAILNEANDWQADLIVLGSRGLTGVKGLFSSVSKDIAISAPCSVEIIRSKVLRMQLPPEELRFAV